MWCIQKPGFETVLLAELQRQQQCSQFCDTMLKTEDVSVPAHSCILSVISPHISSALSSTPPPPPGQRRLLEFQALDACTLLHVVRLLYSGQMVGEGEKEKQEAISAAAKLGIHGLVEVTKTDGKNSQWAETGVQTEPLVENEGRRGRWKREVRDGSIFLWKEMLSGDVKDTWTQTEELEVHTAVPVASFETTDMTCLQSLGQTDSSLLPPEIPCVPISLICQLNENQIPQPSSVPMVSLQESTTAGPTSVAIMAEPPSLPSSSSQFMNHQAYTSVVHPQSWWTDAQGKTGDEWADPKFQQFQDNIPGYINYFLTTEKKDEKSRRGRRRGRRRGAATGGPRRGDAGVSRARRPRRTGGGGRGGFMQTVDVQEVGVSKRQMLFLQRWSMRSTRTGQGGGAAGRKLYLKTRDVLKSAKGRMRARGKMWDISPSGDSLCEGRAHRGGRNTTQTINEDDLRVGQPWRTRAKPAASHCFSSPQMQFYNHHTLSVSSPSFQPLQPPGMWSPTASYVSPASSLLRNTPVPPPPPPPHGERPEQIDRLLEEVMMDLDIIPNTSATQSQPAHSASSSSSCKHATSGSILAQNKQNQVAGVVKEVGSSSTARSAVPVPQQDGAGELNDMLENFLLNFEQHIQNCASREEAQMADQRCTEAPVRICQRNKPENKETESQEYSQPLKPHSHTTFCTKHTEKRREKVPNKRQKTKRKKKYIRSVEKKKTRLKNPAPSSDTKTRMIHDCRDRQLQQVPVVKLERTVPLPDSITLQGNSLQSLNIKLSNLYKQSVPDATNENLKKTNSKSSSMKCHSKNACRATKTYPIRSKFREAHLETLPFLEQALVQHRRSPSVGNHQRRRPKNGQRLSLSDKVQAGPVESCNTKKQLERNQEIPEQELTAQLQEELEESRCGNKRRAEPEKQSDDVSVSKKVCFKQMPKMACKSSISQTECADIDLAAVDMEDIIDVETVSLSTVGCLQREDKSLWYENKLRETEESLESNSNDEIIDVEEDVEDGHGLSLTAPVPVSQEEEDIEDIDVDGGSGPVPDPELISWSGSSYEENQEEEDGVGGEKTAHTSAAIITMS